ncbi:MarR family transcriptional regulator [Tuanshanicoccus lijuaniae]|nr:MarR family transcriptional regulator [Aerococcaceae bacterium zg-1292]MBF6625821.1 MarR family transcriptional regulator [Aerococcaceae bacterium zg-BR9]MBF6978618.1 MarR family transcriptional regulator [Aerococcaceae bacterium zg-BR22]MBS4455603.1 MarR family transcriptional regulator [Aerococcaceae bacterium zg-A91]MBS4457222.1 MarR family transcriptional regulator [Aerococcaceae bacterium zg-BR33]
MERESEALKTYIGLKRTTNRVEADTRRLIAKYNLNMNEYAILEMLYHKGTATMQVIKESILVVNTSITYIVDKLCERNYVQREYDNRDRRIINVSLTDEGKAVIEEVFPVHAEQLTHTFDRLSFEEIKQMRSLLKKLNGLQ